MSQPMPSMNEPAPDTQNMPQDQNMMQDPNMAGDPASTPQGQNMDMPMNNGGGNIERDKKNIQKNIGKACSDFRNYQGQDKADLGKWIEGMLDSLDGDSDDGDVDFETNPDEEIPMESVYTKSQLDKLNEVFGSDDEKETEPKNQEKTTNKTTKSPFNNPKFN